MKKFRILLQLSLSIIMILGSTWKKVSSEPNPILSPTQSLIENNLDLLSQKNTNKSKLSFIRIFSNSTDLKWLEFDSTKVPVNGFNNKVLIPGFFSQVQSIQDKYRSYLIRNKIQYDREELHRFTNEAINNFAFQINLGLDTFLNRRVEFIDGATGISCIGRIKKFEYWNHGAEEEIYGVVTFTNEMLDSLNQIVRRNGSTKYFRKQLKFILPHDDYYEPDSGLSYDIWDFPTSKRPSIYTDEVRDTALDHFQKLDSTTTFTVDSLKLVKSLPGDARGELDYFALQYPLYTNNKIIILSMVILRRNNQYLVIASERHEAPVVYHSYLDRSTGNFVSITNVVDINHDGNYEVGIKKSREVGGDYGAYWTEEYWDLSGEEDKIIWSTSGGGAGC